MTDGGRVHGVAREDLYQLTSYLSAYEGATAGMLGFVDFDPRRPAAGAERDGPWRLASGQELRFVRLPVGEEACVAALRGAGGAGA